MKNKRFIILASIITIIFFAFLIFQILKVRQIVIVGNKNLTDKQIRNTIGVREGDSILYPSSKNLYERLRKISWIKDAIIRKDLNGTLTIYIKESFPIAIATKDEKAYLIDYEAQVLEDFTEKLKNTKILLPILKNIDPFKNKETLQSAVDLINFINSKEYAKPQDEIIITGNEPDNLAIYINNFHIIVGNGDFETKFSKYLIVSTEIQKRGMQIQYIDLRFPDRVIVKPSD